MNGSHRPEERSIKRYGKEIDVESENINYTVSFTVDNNKSICPFKIL